MITSGGMRLSPRRSICLIWAAPKPVVFPVILFMVVSPFQFVHIWQSVGRRSHFSYGQHRFLILDNGSIANEEQFMRSAGNCQSHKS